MNLYAYLGSNPVNLNDALGLTYDDSWLDEFYDDYLGHRLYALGAINEGARWASLGLETSLTIAGSLLAVDVFYSVAAVASGQGGFWAAMDIVTSVVPGRGPLRAMAKMRKYARLAKKGGRGIESMSDLLKLSRRWRTGVNPAKVAEAGVKYPKKAGKRELHHIIPNYLGGPANGPKVPVDGAYHQLITNEFRGKWKYGQGRTPDVPELERFLDEVYAKYPLPE